MSKETDIQKTVCEYLALKKHFFWRSNNIPVYDPKIKRYRKMPEYSMKGVPDVIVIGEIGQFIGLEFKQKGKYLSKDQKLFKEKVEAKGGEYYLIRSLEDAKEVGL